VISIHAIGSKSLGGAERFCLRLIDALRGRGESISVLVRQGSEVMRAVPEGVPLLQSPMKTVWDPWSKWDMSRIIRAVRPDIVQTYMGRATRLTRLPVERIPVHVARLGGYYKLAGYRHAHAWVGNTKGLCDYMIRNGLPAGRVYHIGNFIDIPPPLSPDERAALRDKWRLPPGAYVLLTAGRFVEVKGQRYVLDALARLPAELDGRPLRLVMLGEGVLGDALRHQAAQLAIQDRIVWTGWQNDPAPFFDLADQVVFPSLDRETFGNVILEAWAHRRPIVVSRFRGAREITHHGIDAWQVPCEDAQALALGIRHVAEDPGLAASLAMRGYERVRADFSRAAIADQYIALYRDLVDRVSRRGIA
jgi:glycosyltransferase involved in cell wall biosynthesis